MTAALEGGQLSAGRPGRALPPGKTRYPLYRRLGGPQSRSGRVENLAPPGFDPRTVQPVVSRYTYWATRPTFLTVHCYNVWSDTHLFVLRWRSWLRNCDTSWKVASFIPDGVTGIFLRCNRSGRLMSLGSSHPLSTKNISWEPQTPETLRTCSVLYRVYFTSVYIFTYENVHKI